MPPERVSDVPVHEEGVIERSCVVEPSWESPKSEADAVFLSDNVDGIISVLVDDPI